VSEYTERASAFALKAHGAEMRRGGEEPYYNHVKRVGDAVGRVVGISDDATAAGYLHDVFENTAVTYNALRAAGFTERTCHLTHQLTRRVGESYNEYIARLISTNDIELLYIKLKDNDDNSIVNPLFILQGMDNGILRYAKSKIKLIDAIRDLYPAWQSPTKLQRY